MSITRVFVLAFVVSAAGCSNRDATVHHPIAGTLVIQPAELTVTVESDEPLRHPYTALVTDERGASHDVTRHATFQLTSSGLGTFEDHELVVSPTRAGEAGVLVTYDDRTAEGRLTVEIRRRVRLGGAPENAFERFDEASPDGVAPTIVYPPSGALVPPNLRGIEVHFLPGEGNDLFEITLEAPGVDLRVYTPCQPVGTGCGYAPDEEIWTAVAESARDSWARLRVRGLARSTAPDRVGSSAVHDLGFTNEDLAGGLYFWNADRGGLMRYDFGREDARPEMFLGPDRAGDRCVGCHSISRDGSRIAVGLGEPFPGDLAMYGVAERELEWERAGDPPRSGGDFAPFVSFSPDATQLLASDQDVIRLLDVETGEGDVVLERAIMPAWSPRGDRVVFVEHETVEDDPCEPGSIDCGPPPLPMERSPKGLFWAEPGTWTRNALVLPTRADLLYPDFSPDGRWLLYNRRPFPVDGHSSPDEVFLSSVDGGEPVRLLAAGDGTWPRFAPFVDSHEGRSILWLSLTSTRNYGLRLDNERNFTTRTQLHLVAIDVSRAEAGDDPSHPALWLPGQDLITQNLLGQWVERVARQECSDERPCPSGESCEDGSCVVLLE